MAHVIDIGKAQAARLQGLHYFWHVELRNGEQRDQFDGGGVENSLQGIPMVRKSIVDPYSDSMVFEGVKTGAWIPTFGDGEFAKVFSLKVEEGHGLVLYRKTYAGTSGFNYKVYVIGTRNERDGNPLERVWQICPPVTLPPREARDKIVFGGAVTETTSPLALNAFDEFANSDAYGAF